MLPDTWPGAWWAGDGGTLMLWSGTSGQLRQTESREASRGGGTGRARAELGRVRLEVVIWSGNWQLLVSSRQSTVNSQHCLTIRQLQPELRTELNSNFDSISLRKVYRGFSHLLVTFLSVFISRHCQNIQKHSDALTFLHYLLWGQWG